MTEGDALVYAYLLDGKGGGEVVGWPAIDNWDSSQGLRRLARNRQLGFQSGPALDTSGFEND
jgi:hypothetical protein